MWLKTPIEERDDRGGRRMTGRKRSTRETPQGGVISPLLANIYMHRFLRAWRERGKGEHYQARVISAPLSYPTNVPSSFIVHRVALPPIRPS
jgi:RNA-directed DNA polymerase